STNIDLISEPRLSDNFRLLIPLPGLEGNYINGNEQKLESVIEEPENILLRWKSPLENARGKFDVRVSMTISLRNERVEFRLALENHTRYPVGEVWYPILGGITGVGDRADTQEMIPFRG